MGVHEAYHLSRANRIIHWLCIPLELLAVLKLLSLVALGPIDLAVVVIIGVGVIYLATEPLAGALMILGLVGLHAVALRCSTGALAIDAAAAVGLFVVPFVIQTRVGHQIYEQGIDDTEKNLAELRRRLDPIPILLVFYYHLVEILFAFGYRPALRREVERYRDDELARIVPDPRRSATA